MTKLNLEFRIQDLKVGDYFKRKIDAKKTYEKRCFCRFNQAYECVDIEDVNSFIYIKKDKLVF